MHAHTHTHTHTHTHRPHILHETSEPTTFDLELQSYIIDVIIES